MKFACGGWAGLQHNVPHRRRALQISATISSRTVADHLAAHPTGLALNRRFGSVLVGGFITVVVVARVAAFALLKADPAYTFVPRSFIGGGWQTMPALLDLVLPVMVVLVLWPRPRLADHGARHSMDAAADAVLFLLFPLVAGGAMFAYEGHWQIVPNVALASALRWLQFVTAFAAWNLLLDQLHSRWQRIIAVPILAACFGLLQDLYPGMPSFYILITVG